MAVEQTAVTHCASHYLQVDIFSFGMFLYELISLHFPFEKQNLMGSQIEKLIIEGERPPLQNRVHSTVSNCYWPSKPLMTLLSHNPPHPPMHTNHHSHPTLPCTQITTPTS